MLSDKEKKEILKDTNSIERRKLFSFGKYKVVAKSFDEYLLFLKSVQTVFTPFSIPHRTTLTRHNKL